MADIDIIIDNSDVKESRDAMKAWAKETRDSIREVNRSMNLQGKESRRLAAESKRQFASQRALTKQKIREVQQEAKEVERLSQKYKPLFAASKQYERSLNELSRAHKLGVLSTQQHAKAVDFLNSEYSSFQAGTAGWSNQFVQGSNRAGKSMNRFGMISQQVGYQVGDFFVQVQSGQNVMVAFAQQGTQLAGLLPGIAGAVVGIGLSLAGMLYQMARARNGTKEAEDALKSLKDEAASVVKQIDDLANSWEDAQLGRFSGQRTLEEQLIDAEKRAVDTRVALEKLTASTEAANFTSGLGGGGGYTTLFSGLGGANTALEEAIAADKKAREELERLIAIRTEEAARNANAKAQEIANANVILELQRQYGEESKQVLEEELRQQLEITRARLVGQQTAEEDIAIILQLLTEQHNLTLELEEQAAQQEIINSRQAAFLSNQTDIYSEMAKSREEGKALAEELVRAYQAGLSLSTVDVGAGVDAAAIAAAELARQMGISLAVAKGMVALAQAGITAAPGGPDQAVNNVRDNLTPSGLSEADIVSRVSISARTSRGSSGGGGSSGSAGQAQKTLEQITKEITERDKLAAAVGREGEQLRLVAEIKKSLGDASSKYSDEQIKASAAVINNLREQQRVQEEVLKQQTDLANSIAETMGDSFMSVIDGTASVEDAFRDMARSIIRELYEVLVVQRLVGSFDASTGVGSGLAGLIGGLMPFANGGVINKGKVTPFANGGVVSSPTMFPMKGGSGLMGEAGPEAIMPLSRGPDGKLGVRSSNSGGSSIVIHVDARGAQEGVAAQIEQKLSALAPKLVAQSVKTTKRSMTKTKSGWFN